LGFHIKHVVQRNGILLSCSSTTPEVCKVRVNITVISIGVVDVTDVMDIVFTASGTTIGFALEEVHVTNALTLTLLGASCLVATVVRVGWTGVDDMYIVAHLDRDARVGVGGVVPA
jgi:hypothetical protein